MSEYYNQEDRIVSLEKKIAELVRENETLKSQVHASATASTSGKKRRRGAGIGKLAVTAVLGNRFRKSLLKLYHEIPEKQIQRETLAEVTAHLLWRLTRIGLFGIFFAIIPAAMIIMQTVLMNRQNKLIVMQNETQERISEKQNGLLEFQNQLLSRQLEQSEADNQKNIVRNRLENIKRDLSSESRDSRGRRVSSSLLSELSNFSKSLNAMDTKESDQGVEVLVSGEKGDLLLSLIGNRLEEDVYKVIYSQAVFDEADLDRAELDGAFLSGISLNNGFLRSANLRNADLKFAQLKNANLKGAFLSNAKLNRANLASADAREAFFVKSVLINTDLSYADLRGADLRGADLHGTRLEGARLENAKVDTPDWFEAAQEAGIEGWQNISTRFRVATNRQEDEFGQPYFLIVAN